MKKYLYILSPLLVLVLFFSACVSSTPGAAPTSGAPATAYLMPPSSQQTGLWVNGEGKATYAPDIAVLSLGIEAQEKTVAQAQNSARDAMSKVLAALKSRNVADKDIRTQTFNIQPIKQWLEAIPTPTPRGTAEPQYKPPPKEVIVGYRVSNTVTVKIRKIDDAGSVIDAVAAGGGDLTRINSIGFTIEDAAPFRAQAREMAVKDALNKAKQITTAAGVTLGRVTYITESGGFVPKADVRSFGVAMAASEAAPTSISPGELELSVSVQMVFDMK